MVETKIHVDNKHMAQLILINWTHLCSKIPIKKSFLPAPLRYQLRFLKSNHYPDF